MPEWGAFSQIDCTFKALKADLAIITRRDPARPAAGDIPPLQNVKLKGFNFLKITNPGNFRETTLYL